VTQLYAYVCCVSFSVFPDFGTWKSMLNLLLGKLLVVSFFLICFKFSWVYISYLCIKGEGPK
jgi:hypothetical protein